TSPDTTISKEVIKGKAVEKGVETIFVTRLKDIKEQTERIPVPITGSGRTGIYIPGDRYNLPEMEMKQTRVILESRLYEVETEKLIWSADSDIFDPKSAEGVVQSLSRTITENLKDQKLLK
ncbi:MAG: hypothetical protein JRJ85_22130, partial [Deltaproteobacteria bacterium]|nr:hypothetical protein [Deltaproteobacteria bacterium]